MAGKEEGEETTPQGNEWEVVSLTASAYAAAPGPEQVKLNDNDEGNAIEGATTEASRAMFMSGHFIVPPSQADNLPAKPENIEIQNIQGIDDDASELSDKEGRSSDAKDVENWSIKELAMPDEFPGLRFFDEKGNNLSSIHGSEFDEGTTLKGLNLSDKGQSMYSDSKFSSFDSETTAVGSITYDENTIIPGQTKSSEGGLDSNTSPLPKAAKEVKHGSSELPGVAWWRRQAASLYSQAKEANAVWSIFIAAAVVGLVILGQRWQQERRQPLQLRWQFSIK